jgi:hypothetical protein
MYIYTIDVGAEFVPECSRVGFFALGSPDLRVFAWLGDHYQDKKQRGIEVVNPFVITARQVEKKSQLKIVEHGRQADLETVWEFAPLSAATGLCFKSKPHPAGRMFLIPDHMLVPVYPQKQELDRVMERFSEDQFFSIIEENTIKSEKIWIDANTVYKNAMRSVCSDH